MTNYGLYVHIPFCPYKCHYCDFLTFSNVDRKIDQYMKYLFKEINMYGNKNYNLDTVFIGGGTPSYIDPKYIECLMSEIKKVFNLSNQAEISIETNPNTLDEKKIKTYLSSGINRFSLGVQTFDNDILKILGRDHTKEIVIKDIDLLRKLGVKNLSIDMMLANPKQDMKVLKSDLEMISKLDIDHISYYSLLLEDKTLFKHWLNKGLIELFDDDLERQMFDEVKEKLKDLRFKRYEISNFARSSFQSIHNSKYWKQEPYLAVGLGATSNFDGNRRTNHRKFTKYFESLDERHFPVERIEKLSKEDREKEFIIMYMRMVDGFDIDEINQKYKIDFLSKYRDIINKHIRLNTVEIVNNRFRFTDYGLDVSNQFYIDIL